MSFFRKLHTRNKTKIEVQLGLSNYAKKKTDLKNAKCVDTSDFAKIKLL